MKANPEQVLTLVYDCLKELNELLPPTAQLRLERETILLGEAGGLDSLGAVNLVAAIEEKIETRFGLRITLPLTESGSDGEDPWQNIGTLVAFLAGVINSQQSS